jgi:multiple sugar transport system substrate-binding protein/putative aldouronate transport system substrate-binding protein
MLFNWDDDDVYKDYGQDIKKYFSDAVDANKELNDDGKLYGIGNSLTNTEGQHDLFVYDWGTRWDLYEKLGCPTVSNLDDLASVLQQMQALCPTGDDGKKTYAASLWPDWDGNMVMYVKGLASAYYGYDELGIGMYDSKTGDFYDCLDKNGPYMQCLKFFNTLYRNGLLDPDSMTQTYDTMISKVRSGDVLFSIFNYAGTLAFNSTEHEAKNEYMASLVPTQASVEVNGLSTCGSSRIWSIGANSVYPEECMELIDWLCTPEGAMTNMYGPKGLMWDYDDNGNTYFTDLGKECYKDSTTDLTGVKWTSPYTGKTYTLSGTYNDGAFQFNNTTWASGAKNPDAADDECFYPATWKSEIGDASCESEGNWRTATKATNTQDYLDSTDITVVPAVNYAETTRDDELDLKWQQVIKSIKEGSWNAIYASSDDEFNQIIDSTISSCDGYGYDDCVDWCKKEAARKYKMQQEASN